VSVIRHWLMVRPDGTLDMIDSAAVADRLKGEGKRLLGPYVPAEQLQGAVKALEAIRREGKVCDEYEVCEHRACQSSYTAWAIADRYLGGQ
jgi:hypothetical protein